MNDKSTKLLDYVQMLDNDLSVGGFSHVFDLQTRIAEGRIQSQEELEGFILHPLMKHLVRQDGTAIQAIYEAADQQDIRQIARIDRHILGRIVTNEDDEAACQRGRRLLKLAQALYPWLNLKALDEIAHEDRSPVCLATAHAYVNYQLGSSCDHAVYGYMQSAVCTCIQLASRSLNIPRLDAKTLAGKWTAEMERVWMSEKSCLPKNLFNIQENNSHIAS
ncbi:urease accessory protein UreF [Paenibacillus sp. XY044]|uniref:urease accessory protein UreF n=1 Tax=Paenibacillus sp. XY044 TaxID=2026089 RepID=UPI000B98391B|nr:urease accessory UreF family protein [Paenibacillus sp. XY044]OZB96058.1 hypothetical protein CJP46_09030 [Paenibacillus sp. XY044]